MRYDVVVVGVGGLGAAAADALAGRGRRVLALEQYAVGHDRGSSHGLSRIVRQAYFESPAYLPLLRRAYALWDGFPPACRLHRVGCLLLGAADSPVITGAARSAAEHGVPIERWSAARTEARFPQFHPAATEEAVFEPDAGWVSPEATVAFLAGRARERGAILSDGERVLGFDLDGPGVVVRTDRGRHRADRLVLTAGAWTPGLAPELALPVRVERRVMHFFRPEGDPRRWTGEVMPTFIWDLDQEDSIYGFPLDGAAGVKAAFHNRGPVADPDRPAAAPSPAEESALRGVLADRLPGLAGPLVRAVPCLYDLTPDQNFLLGFAPGTDERVVVAAGTSGHGFKFVPVIGEVVTDLLTRGDSGFDLGFLDPGRFAAGRPGPPRA